jgi:hypothetical protein
MRRIAMLPTPAPAFEWLLAVGGPCVGEHDVVVHLDGERWTTERYDGADGWLQFHDATAPAVGHVARALTRSYDGPGMFWAARLKIAEAVYARVDGRATDFATALSAVRAVDFTPHALGGGLPWYRNGSSANWIAAFNGQALRLSEHATDRSNRPWRWSLDLAEGSALERLGALFGVRELTGTECTAPEAIYSALRAPHRAAALAAELLGNHLFSADPPHDGDVLARRRPH